MSHAAAFSPDYTAARARFRSSSLALGCALEEHPVEAQGPDGEDLTIDVARLGADRARKVLVVSSGLHGVEGFLGSAIQAALLEEHLGGWKPPPDCALVMIHALNPYGFAWRRRVNEDNVDLNRNFLLPGEAFAGSPEMYGPLDPFFNPARRPNPFEPFILRAIGKIAKHGYGALKDTLPVGQFDFPKGLFFGGTGPSATQRILDAELPRWIDGAEHVVHLDVHSGQGKWGKYILAINHDEGSERTTWMRGVFGDHIESWDPKATLYTIRGGLGRWCAARFPTVAYDEMTAEFGTYHTLRVVSALRDENMATHHCEAGDPALTRTRERLMEIFAPADPAWRDSCVEQGVALVGQAIEATFA